LTAKHKQARARAAAWRFRDEVSMMRRAFTAVELAVVFILIAVLAVLVLPVLEDSRQAAIKTTCLAQVRQIGYSFAMYQTDHDGAWPWARESVASDHPAWPDPTGSLALLYPAYAPKPYLFRCPATDDLVVLDSEGKDFVNCANFYVSPGGDAMQAVDAGKGTPAPPSYFYDCGGSSGSSIPPGAASNRVVYGDECVHHGWRNEAGRDFWMGENNHDGGGNFLFVDKHVEWLDLQWTGIAWHEGESEPFVPNPHLKSRSSTRRPGESIPPMQELDALLDKNVFWLESDKPSHATDADLAGMMWFDGSWKEF
jgi:prepilin-type processing-associated H-X9-DG protein